MKDRWAVISDIHGNVDALRAVFAEIDRLGCSRILNLGDHVSGPLAAAETLDEVMARDDMISVHGNHDRYVLRAMETLGPSDAVAAAQLTEVHKDWLAALPAAALIEDVFLCHGTPDSDETYWLHDVTPQGDVVDRGGSAVAELAATAPAKAQVLLCGHTHLPRIIQLASGAVVLNPGSVGLPAYDDVTPVPHVVQSGDPAARFALMERRNTEWDMSLRRVPYDASRMVDLAQRNNRPDWAHPLQTGWFDT
ncbi:metallophosphoesterase family protein [Shimia sagamensis]|uniref:Phosphoesterase, MJ0936 family n=1 Tax=Shimia sagamensis TaxID=1566352 RepID=A0ABY1NVV1_9RHOB|nr:metallophosphoesterase family protein [Shimia sagamensis]SMP17219.1 phosphoesterase, MJ0936 family [Shimia sagamensis]